MSSYKNKFKSIVLLISFMLLGLMSGVYTYQSAHAYQIGGCHHDTCETNEWWEFWEDSRDCENTPDSVSNCDEQDEGCAEGPCLDP